MNYSHPAFAPYRELLAELKGETGLKALNALAADLNIRQAGQPLRFVASNEPLSAAGYETGIGERGEVPSRENNLHDFLNALVWLRFPQLKSALNARHCQALTEHPEERRQRGRLRDQLTLLDESGLLVASSKPELLERLREKCWVELFWEARAEVIEHMQFIVVGHGLLDKCLAPFPAMTGKCLFLHPAENSLEALDALAARMVCDAESLELPPLPIQGVPGWDSNDEPDYYRNTAIFRPRPGLAATA